MTVVSLDDGDQLEVRMHDMTVRCEMGYNGYCRVHVSRPTSDGRSLGVRMRPKDGTPHDEIVQDTEGDYRAGGIEMLSVAPVDVKLDEGTDGTAMYDVNIEDD